MSHGFRSAKFQRNTPDLILALVPRSIQPAPILMSFTPSPVRKSVHTSRYNQLPVVCDLPSQIAEHSRFRAGAWFRTFTGFRTRGCRCFRLRRLTGFRARGCRCLRFLFIQILIIFCFRRRCRHRSRHRRRSLNHR